MAKFFPNYNRNFLLFVGEHRSAEFLKLNPNGEVPVLVDADLNIYDAVPILLYLAEKYTKFISFGETEKDIMMVYIIFVIYLIMFYIYLRV